MPPSLIHGLELLLLTAGCWLADRLIRQNGFLRGLNWLGIRSFRTQLTAWAVPCLILTGFWSWEQVPQAEAVRWLSLILSGLLCWKAVTEDIDVVTRQAHWVCRGLLPGAIIGVWFSPACLLLSLFLLTTPFGVWEHHATLPMRVLQAVMAWLVLASGFAFSSLELFSEATVLFFFVLIIQISHYLITALAKGWLGPKWYSWVIDNRIHHLAATAYSWGWARFIPWQHWRRVIAALRLGEKPLQLAAFSLELLAPLALWDPAAGIGFCICWSMFHVGVFLCSGLLFWEWIGTNLAVAVAILLLSTEVTPQIFSPGSVLASLIFLALFPLRHKLWKPMPLGWWDTPFTQRMHWQAVGASGSVYGVYNTFMCPHERLYGKVHACFLAPVAGFTYHLGEVWKHDLRDAIRAAGPDAERLESVREQYGVQPVDERLKTNHLAYLRRFFHAINCGQRKHVLPPGLRWLKAPGDQLYYWGELPAFWRQEQGAAVRLVYREEYFDGRELRRLRDQLVLELPIDASAADVPCEPEPTPKQIDDLLLRFANGKIIDLPDFSAGYVHGDDGKCPLDNPPRN